MVFQVISYLKCDSFVKLNYKHLTFEIAFQVIS